MTPPPLAAERAPNEHLGILIYNYRHWHPQGSTCDGTLPGHTVITRANRRRADRVIWTGLGRTQTPRKISRRSWWNGFPNPNGTGSATTWKNWGTREIGIAEYWVFDRFERTLSVYSGTPVMPMELVIHGVSYCTPAAGVRITVGSAAGGRG